MIWESVQVLESSDGLRNLKQFNDIRECTALHEWMSSNGVSEQYFLNERIRTEVAKSEVAENALKITQK